MKPIRWRAPRLAAAAMALGLTALVAGCVYYPPPGTPVPVAPSTFDRAWDAALGAMVDNGLVLTSQDRSTGTVSGRRGDVTVTATVRPQADGTTRVEFGSRSDSGQDGGLTQRVLSSYNTRMGR
jgi:hypothetical protein